MNRFVIIIPILALGCGYGIFREYRLKHRLRMRLRARPQLNDREFGCQYFPKEQAEIAVDIRRLLARHLPCSPAGLHPDDKFQDDLRLDTFNRTGLIEFLMAVETHFKVELRHRDDIQIRSFGELVTAVAKELQ
jgi:acyl carrier protein